MRHADGGDPVEPDQDPAVGGDDLFVTADEEVRPRRRAPRAPRRWLLVAAAAAVLVSLGAGVGLGLSMAGPDAPAAAPVPAPTVTVTSEPEQLLAASGPVPDPARVEIPSLGIDSPLIDLFVSEDGTMGVPTTAEQIGWWEDGPVPGEPGASLIAAHVQLGGADGAFLELGTLAVGAEVVVDRVDGSSATYAVTSVEQFPKDDFPDERVYTFDGPSRLHLVTCGGTIDRDTGHYDDNIVVFADLVSDTRAPAST